MTERGCVQMGRRFAHIGKFLDVCTFALKKTICQTPALLGFDSGGEICSFPLYVHMCERLCILWVHYSSAMCCLSFTQRMPPICSQNRGFVVTPLKKLKSLSRQKQSAEAHKYLCGYGRRWQPFSYSHSAELKASVLVHEIFLFSPMGGALYHLAGDPEHLSPPKAEGNAP